MPRPPRENQHRAAHSVAPLIEVSAVFEYRWTLGREQHLLSPRRPGSTTPVDLIDPPLILPHLHLRQRAYSYLQATDLCWQISGSYHCTIPHAPDVSSHMSDSCITPSRFNTGGVNSVISSLQRLVSDGTNFPRALQQCGRPHELDSPLVHYLEIGFTAAATAPSCLVLRATSLARALPRRESIHPHARTYTGSMVQ
jgi:hypothetical protein